MLGLPLAILLWARCRPSAAMVVPGVAPTEQAKYSPATFRCFDGSGPILAATVVNDEFCDCMDGSDEPGTGACAGQDKTLFFCVNEGSVAKQIYSSQVGDGLCDCCDGSDEATLSGRIGSSVCANACALEGERLHKELEMRADTIKRGVARQQEIQSAAVIERAGWRWELSGLERELPALEAKLSEAKRRSAALKEAEEREKAAANATEVGRLRLLQALASVGAQQANETSKPEPPASEAASSVATETQTTTTASPEKEEAPQVSEYAKWMDGAESTLESKDDADVSKAGDAKVSEYTKWMDGAEAVQSQADEGVVAEDDLDEDDTGDEDDMSGEEDDPDEVDMYAEDEEDDEEGSFSLSNSYSSTVRKRGEEAASPDTASTAGTTVTLSEEQKAQEEVTRNKRRTTELKKNLALLSEEHLGFASLADKTLQKKVAEFEYKVSFFTNAKQDHTSLGRWKGFTGPNTAEFTDGAGCWQGPARKLKITFQCGVEEAIEDVTEPSRCVYAATVSHPGACDPTELQTLVVGSRVTGPHDEL